MAAIHQMDLISLLIHIRRGLSEISDAPKIFREKQATGEWWKQKDPTRIDLILYSDKCFDIKVAT